MSLVLPPKPIWSTAVPDWERRIVQGETLIPFAPLFPAEAESALDIFNKLKIVDAAGSPTMGQASRQWVTDFTGTIFGAYDHNSGRRLINDYMLLISKKNSKSTLAAGIMLTALMRNWRPSGEFIILAPTKEVAKNSFDPAHDMIQHDPRLREMLHSHPTTRLIEHRVTKATLKVVAADSDTVAGIKAIGVLIDELWLFGNKANAENMLREATGGLASRPEGFVIALSTQGDKRPAGVFKKRLDYFREVRDGKRLAPKSFGVLYEFPPDMLKSKSYAMPANWWMTNPNLGASVDEEFLSDEFAKAEAGGPDSLANFYAKHLNVEIGVGYSVDSWAGGAFWEKRVDTSLTLETLLARSEVVTIGVDGGGLDDLLGLCIMGREKVTRRWLCICYGWAHRIVLERRKEIAPKLIELDRTEYFEIVDDEAAGDVEALADIVEQVRDSRLLPETEAIGADPAGVNDIVDELERRGFTVGKDGEVGDIVPISQGFKLQPAVKAVERKLSHNQMAHDGSALMTWCVGNAKVEQKGNALMVTKQIAGTAKIDPVMAMFNAAMLMALNPVAGGSVYDALESEADEEPETDDKQTPSDDEYERILRDPTHPKWEEARDRYNEKLAMADEDF